LRELARARVAPLALAGSGCLCYDRGQCFDLIKLEEVYAARLDRLRPTRADLRRIAQAYRETMVPEDAEQLRQSDHAAVLRRGLQLIEQQQVHFHI
jgi:hypothetical protein